MRARTFSLLNPFHLTSFLNSPEWFFRTHFDASEPFYMVNAGIFKICVLTCPELAYQVIHQQNDSLRHGLGTGKMRKLTGNGVLSSEGAVHESHRKILAPLFAPDHVSKWKDFFSAVFNMHLKTVDTSAPVDWHKLVHPMASEIVLQTFFGVKDLRDLKAVQDVIEELLVLFTRPSMFQLQFSKKARLIRACVSKALGHLHETPPLFEVLPHGTSEDEKLDHAVSLILAGIDTLSWAFTWTAGLLAQHPEWTNDDDPKSVGAVVSETLRLYPTVWSIARNAVQDIQMPEGSLPHGTRFVAPLTVLHRHPRYWKDPDRFDPHRFTHPEPRPRMAYAPFGVGGYSCLGLRFAMVAMEAYVTCLIRVLSLREVAPLPPTRGSVTLTSRAPVLIKASFK